MTWTMALFQPLMQCSAAINNIALVFDRPHVTFHISSFMNLQMFTLWNIVRLTWSPCAIGRNSNRKEYIFIVFGSPNTRNSNINSNNINNSQTSLPKQRTKYRGGLLSLPGWVVPQKALSVKCFQVFRWLWLGLGLWLELMSASLGKAGRIWVQPERNGKPVRHSSPGSYTRRL